jgi:5-methyltetrahydropteroyltriglutamate--homocysteine methyltransferase
MPDRILTSHAGSLPRPDELIEANRERQAGELADEAAYGAGLAAAVAGVVARQRDTGIDLVNNGEFGHTTAQR